MPPPRDSDDDLDPEGPSRQDLRDLSDDDTDVTPCPACGADVYEDAERCPHCGAYIVPGRAGAGWRRWVVIAAVLALAGLVVWLIAD